MNLKTKYLNLELKHPLVLSASPLTKQVDSLLSLEEAGFSAVVMHSLFEEQIAVEENLLDHYLNYGSESVQEVKSYFPDLDHYNVGPDEYLKLIQTAKQKMTIPIIGSLNGSSKGGWIEYAKKIEGAGADALELNIYYIPANPDLTSQNVEQVYIDILREVKSKISIPVSVKLGPFFSSPAHISSQLAKAGANGLVLFNRFYQPDFDLEQLEVLANLELSRSYEMRLPLLWIAILYGRVSVDLALSSGVHSYEDVLKGVMAGANVTMITSEILQKGTGRVKEILAQITQWMETHEYESIEQMRGSMSQKNVADSAAFERANYMKVLQSFHPDPTSVKLS